MPVHWTYEKIAPADDSLMQGDILWPTEELKSLFEKVHPHFCDPKYIGFIVITQSCDLVRRDGRTCRADYINLAVIRELESCLSQFFDHICERVAAGVYLQRSKIQAQQLLERILNQNEQSLGLFYLYPDADTVGIADHAVALLRVSVAFRKEHYDLLRQARKGRLTAEFRSKLGWLVGNLYSRVGTRDWTDNADGENELKQLIHRLVNSDLYLWISKSSLSALMRAGVSVPDVPFQDFPSILEEHNPPPFKDEIAQAAMKEAAKLLARVPNEVLGQLGSSASLPEASAEAVKSEIRDVLESVLSPLAGKIKNRLVNDPVVSRAVDRDELR